MHRTTAALAVFLATTALAAAQTNTGPIGGDPIGGVPIGSNPIGAPATSGEAPVGTSPGVAGSGGLGVGAGAATGARVDAPMRSPPSRVRGYVSRQSGPSATLTRPLVIGQPLPAGVDLRAIPNSSYRYGLVDGRRAIIEPGSRRVIEVIE